MGKRITAFFLLMILAAGLMPAAVFAAEGDQDYDLRVVDFEGAYWDALIDEPQYGGPLLYGPDGNGMDEPYGWTDEATGLSHTMAANNAWGPAYCYWSYGEAISNYASGAIAEHGGYQDQLTVYKEGEDDLVRTGGGHNGSNNFVVHYGYADTAGYGLPESALPRLSFTNGPHVIDHMYIKLTDYLLNCIADGNDLTAAMGDDDILYVRAIGYNADGSKANEVRMNVCEGTNLLVKDWTKWDLSGLGAVSSVALEINGSSDNGAGFSQPAYFAFDDVAVRVPKAEENLNTIEVNDENGTAKIEIGGATVKSVNKTDGENGPVYNVVLKEGTAKDAAVTVKFTASDPNAADMDAIKFSTKTQGPVPNPQLARQLFYGLESVDTYNVTLSNGTGSLATYCYNTINACITSYSAQYRTLHTLNFSIENEGEEGGETTPSYWADDLFKINGIGYSVEENKLTDDPIDSQFAGTYRVHLDINELKTADWEIVMPDGSPIGYAQPYSNTSWDGSTTYTVRQSWKNKTLAQQVKANTVDPEKRYLIAPQSMDAPSKATLGNYADCILVTFDDKYVNEAVHDTLVSASGVNASALTKKLALADYNDVLTPATLDTVFETTDPYYHYNKQSGFTHTWTYTTGSGKTAVTHTIPAEGISYEEIQKLLKNGVFNVNLANKAVPYRFIVDWNGGDRSDAVPTWYVGKVGDFAADYWSDTLTAEQYAKYKDCYFGYFNNGGSAYVWYDEKTDTVYTEKNKTADSKLVSSIPHEGSEDETFVAYLPRPFAEGAICSGWDLTYLNERGKCAGDTRTRLAQLGNAQPQQIRSTSSNAPIFGDAIVTAQYSEENSAVFALPKGTDAYSVTAKLANVDVVAQPLKNDEQIASFTKVEKKYDENYDYFALLLTDYQDIWLNKANAYYITDPSKALYLETADGKVYLDDMGTTLATNGSPRYHLTKAADGKTARAAFAAASANSSDKVVYLHVDESALKIASVKVGLQMYEEMATGYVTQKGGKVFRYCDFSRDITSSKGFALEFYDADGNKVDADTYDWGTSVRFKVTKNGKDCSKSVQLYKNVSPVIVEGNMEGFDVAATVAVEKAYIYSNMGESVTTNTTLYCDNELVPDENGFYTYQLDRIFDTPVSSKVEAVYVRGTLAVDEEAIKAAEDEIAKIDAQVTADSEAQVKAAREAYDALTSAEQKRVSNVIVLEKAEVALMKLEAEKIMAQAEAAQQAVAEAQAKVDADKADVEAAQAKADAAQAAADAAQAAAEAAQAKADAAQAQAEATQAKADADMEEVAAVKKAVEEAQAAADAAQAAAESAQAKADTAQKEADEAMAKVEAAQKAVEAAQAKADAAQKAAEEAQAKVDADKADVEAAKKAVEQAQAKADAAQAAAEAAQTKADAAQAKAEAAQKAAEEAQTKADAAQSKADAAQAAADTAQAAAEAAQAKADADQKAADEAQAKADADQKAADEAQAKADADQKAAQKAQSQAASGQKTAAKAQAKADAALKAAQAAQAKADAALKAAKEAQAFVKKQMKVKKLKAKKKAIKVKFTKVKGADGYQIRYSTKKSMSKAKTIKVKSWKTFKKTIKKLKAGKKYYVKVRAYKYIDGKKYVTAYSGKKSVKTKK